MTPLLEVDHLQEYFPVRRGILSRTAAYVRAVDDVSFQIAEGETLGLVGESGCGKTTVGRTLLRLIEPTAGEVVLHVENQAISLLDLNARALKRLRPRMQMIFQD